MISLTFPSRRRVTRAARRCLWRASPQSWAGKSGSRWSSRWESWLSSALRRCLNSWLIMIHDNNYSKLESIWWLISYDTFSNLNQYNIILSGFHCNSTGWFKRTKIKVNTTQFREQMNHQGCNRYKYFGSPNQIQNQIGLVLLVWPDTCDDTSQPCESDSN